MNRIKCLLFDWGDTLMVDYPQYNGSMAFWEKVSPMPGVIEAMPILHAHFKCIVASNAGDSNAELMKQAFGRISLNDYFHDYITSKELGVMKPSPLFFQNILAKYGLVADETVMIGNDYSKDISGAKAVGLKTVFISNQEGSFPDADSIVQSFDMLPTLFIDPVE
jgi:putative hydrolase of the HAD superfamily